jgi:hypothetical protein
MNPGVRRAKNPRICEAVQTPVLPGVSQALGHTGGWARVPLTVRGYTRWACRAGLVAGVSKDRELLEEARLVAVLGTDADWLAAGQALAYVLLRARAEGVSASM